MNLLLHETSINRGRSEGVEEPADSARRPHLYNGDRLPTVLLQREGLGQRLREGGRGF